MPLWQYMFPVLLLTPTLKSEFYSVSKMKKLLIYTLLAVWGGISLHASPEGSKPNIVFILTDDQGYGDLSCYGSEMIATPNIDRLCHEGMKFDSFYVHNRCSPSRAAFMTGSHAGRTGIGNVVYRWEGNGINKDEITVAELLRDSGYVTGMVGKWHLGSWEPFNPVNHGFDSFYGFFYQDDETKGLFKDLEMIEKIEGQTNGIYSPKLRQAGIDFIKQVTAKNREQGTETHSFSTTPHPCHIPNGFRIRTLSVNPNREPTAMSSRKLTGRLVAC